MHRIDNATAATAMPEPLPAGTPGFFSRGDEVVGQMATIVEYDWANAVQEELMSIVLRGGVTPDKANTTQVLQALANLFTGAYIQITASQSLLVPPYATKVAFRMVGSGGGGAHCQSDGTSYVSGGGGGSGAYAEAQRDCIPGELLTAVIGVGGISEAGGTTTSLAAPAGRWTVSAGGGQPALWDAPTNSHGGMGGMPAGGDLESAGTFGGDGEASGVYQPYGYGGPGPWGGGPRAGNVGGTGGPGAPGMGPGAGGAGVYDNTNTGVHAPGGTGANGMIQYRWLP
jgi:hypothetical protein